MCIRPWPGRGRARCCATRWRSSRPRAVRPGSARMRATAPAISLRGAATSRNSATASRSVASGSPIRPWKRSSRRTGARREETGHAVPAPLALLHRAQVRHSRRGGCAGAQVFWLLVRTPMARERLYLFDTTLRDGAQTNGVDFTLHDKLAIAAMLDNLGIDYVEGGYPGANPTDTELFAQERKLNSTFTAFGMTRRPGRSTSNDSGLAALLQAEADAICFVAKSWDYHVHVALETSLEENLASIRDSVRAARAKGREVLVDCEHFFDGYKANRDYALACAKAAYEAGARWVVLCDTNGGTLPHEVETIVADVCRTVPGDNVGIHAHNDTEQAVANSLGAVRAGARQIQGTLNGLGERCGNANLVSIIPTLKLKDEFARRFEVAVSDENLKHLAHASRTLDEMLNRAPNRHAPYVGESAFATKAGIHASAILKDPATYEHVRPEAIGNRRRVRVSDQAGKSNLLAELDRSGLIAELA